MDQPMPQYVSWNRRLVLKHGWAEATISWNRNAHCLDLVLNGLLTRRNFWRIPGMLENYTIPKWKEFLKSRKPILRKSYLSTFIHINKHMDGARDIFWIKSLNGTFLALQIKAFGPKNFWFSCMGKKVPFWLFFRIFKNCQNGTFLPMHENQKFFGPNAFIWSATVSYTHLTLPTICSV